MEMWGSLEQLAPAILPAGTSSMLRACADPHTFLPHTHFATASRQAAKHAKFSGREL